MSKADKMFEKLEYKKVRENSKGVEYSFYGMKIIFRKDTREVITNGITVADHLAIHEKMKEMGWLHE